MTLGVLEERLVVIKVPCVGLAVIVTIIGTAGELGPVMMSMMVGPGELVHKSRLGIEIVIGRFSAVRTGALVTGAGGGGLMAVPVLTMIGWTERLSKQLLALTVNMNESLPVKLRLG